MCWNYSNNVLATLVDQIQALDSDSLSSWAGQTGPGPVRAPGAGRLSLLSNHGSFQHCTVQQSHFLHVLCVVGDTVLGLGMQRSQGRQSSTPAGYSR